MRRTVALIAMFATLTVTGCGGAADPGTRSVTRAEIEQAGKKWPFTADTATLTCKDNAVTATIDGKMYALNGTAKSRKAGADLTAVWAEDPNMPGLRVNVGDVIELGLELC